MKKILCMFLALLMFFSFFSTVFTTSAFATSNNYQTTATNQDAPVEISTDDLNVTIGSVDASPNELITVPVSLTNVLPNGICVFNMTINYDKTKLEYMEYEPGSIIKSPKTNFSFQKEKDGTLNMLFLDYTTNYSECITSNGLLLNLTFKVLETSSCSTSLTISKHSFADKDFNQLNQTIIPALINISGSAVPDVFTVKIGSAKGIQGDILTIPINFENVPAKGVAACEMTVNYIPLLLEFLDHETGSILTNPTANFTINELPDGKIKLLFLGNTIKDQHIGSDGLFVKLKFKVLDSFDIANIPTTTINVTNTTFTDIDSDDIIALNFSGQIVLSPPVTPIPTSPKKFTVTVDAAREVSESLLTIPVNLENVPTEGISSIKMNLYYNPDIFDYVSYKKGSIVSNLTVNKLQDGILAIVVDNNDTPKDNYIKEDGKLLTIDFEVHSASDELTNLPLRDTSFLDKFSNPVDAKINPAIVSVVGSLTPIRSNLKITAGPVQGNVGDLIKVPINFEDVPKSGIGAADMRINYDPDLLEYVSSDSGSIVENTALNFRSTLQYPGSMRLLLQCPSKETCISTDGIFSTITFKVLQASDSLTQILISQLTVANSNLHAIYTVNSSGKVNISGQPTPPDTDLQINIGAAQASKGEVVAIPVSLTNVNSIPSLICRINYDTSKLNYNHFQAGSIVKFPSGSFTVIDKENGNLELLFLNYLMCTDYDIQEDGLLVTLYFTVTGTPGKTPLNFSTTIISNNNLDIIDTKSKSGYIDILDKQVSSEENKDSFANDVDLSIGTIETSEGSNVVIPIKFKNIPKAGIGATIFNIGYDTDSLEFVSLKAGNIVPYPEKSFKYLHINKKISISYLYESDFISTEGDFAYMTFKVKQNSGTSKIKFYDFPCIGTPSYAHANINFVNGKVIVSDKLPDEYTISGYISTDFITANSQTNEGFVVKLSGTNIKATTDAEGYFEIKTVPVGTYNIKITKSNFLSRQLENISIDNNKELSTESNPMLLWVGDIEINGAQDGAINFGDIMAICKVFNSLSGDESYEENLDFNKDGALNLEDIMIISKHFNKTSSNYQ